MALWRKNDFDDFEHGVSSLFSDYRNGRGNNNNQLSLVNPHFDVRETDSHFFVHAEFPGVKKEDIQIDFHNGNLIVKGEKKQQKEQNDKYHVYERRYGSFERRIKFPTSAKPEDIKASLVDGVLEVQIPKQVEESGVSRVPIQ